MKRYPFIMRRVGALHLFFDGFIPQNAFFWQFSFISLQCHLIGTHVKSWYKANAVWHELLMKKGIKFLKIKKIRRKRRRGEEEEEEENYR